MKTHITYRMSYRYPDSFRGFLNYNVFKAVVQLDLLCRVLPSEVLVQNSHPRMPTIVQSW